MRSRRKLRAATVVCAAVIAGAAPTGWAAATPAPSDARTVAVAPSPDPFRDLSADEIGDRAVTATQSATSLRMAGRVTSDGQPVDIDLALNDKNECTGQMKIKGGTADLRQAAKITYLKGDEPFWRASMASRGTPQQRADATVELLKDRWLKITPGQSGTSDLSEVCDLKKLLDDMGDEPAERKGLTRGPDAEVEGTPVATLVKKKPGGETTTVSVSQEGKPHILKMVKTGGDEPGSIVLSDYDKPVKVVVPPEKETLDVSKLNPNAPS
ncbi:hypothetical protein [Streptomyces sp. NPDC093600]|uniref:hypothetical protein n=1 Tax=Streptomyces sp. NPDC093600 TaxID=3366047 RepID=UPI00382CAB17